MRKIRVEMDGTPHGTRLFDAESGEELRNITSIEITHRAGHPPMIEITELALVEGSNMRCAEQTEPKE